MKPTFFQKSKRLVVLLLLTLVMSPLTVPFAVADNHDGAEDKKLPGQMNCNLCATGVNYYRTASADEDFSKKDGETFGVPYDCRSTRDKQNVDGEPARQVNNYVCTNLLEPMPITTLGAGDMCLYSRFVQENNTTVKKGYIYIIPNTALEGDAKRINCEAIALPSGLGAIERYVALIYAWASMLIGIICVGMVIVGGIMISIEGANSGNKEAGINMIKNALIGLALLFMAGVLLRMINPTFFT